MSKMTWIVEHERYESDDEVFPKRTITHTIDLDDISWDNLVRQFLGFLNDSGYMIDPVIHGEMARVMSDYHYETVMSRLIVKD